MKPPESADKNDLILRLRAIRSEIRDEYLSAQHNCPWIVGYSGGKDSTLLLQLAFEMLMELAPSDRNRTVHVLTNDTLVESPLIIAYVEKMMVRLRTAADSLRLPIVVAKTTPDIDQTFWVNLIGRGYPAPNRRFRWCTDRMKIQPTSAYIRSQVDRNGEVILLLGVRRAESSARAVVIDRHTAADGSRLNPHDDLKGCMVYRPIMDLSTDEVWEILLQRQPPWGGTHRELVTLYRNAQGGECPLVIDISQAPSCGTSSSRFGCWTCTVVEKDKSMEGFIDAGFEHLEPLLEFRDWLATFRNDLTKRMAERRNGQVAYMADGTLVPGPFTLEARAEILKRLLDLQTEVKMPLISDDEIALIKAIWAQDAVDNARRLVKQNLAAQEGT